MSYTVASWTVPLDTLVKRLTPEANGTPKEVAKRAVALLQELGRPVDSFSHSSEGGDWFRDQFIDVALASLIGAEPAKFLIDRPLAGTEWSGYPSMGWLTKAELNDAVTRLDQADEDALADLDDPDAEELMESVNDILHLAAMSGQDFVTVYS